MINESAFSIKQPVKPNQFAIRPILYIYFPGGRNGQRIVQIEDTVDVTRNATIETHMKGNRTNPMELSVETTAYQSTKL